MASDVWVDNRPDDFASQPIRKLEDYDMVRDILKWPGRTGNVSSDFVYMIFTDLDDKIVSVKDVLRVTGASYRAYFPTAKMVYTAAWEVMRHLGQILQPHGSSTAHSER